MSRRPTVENVTAYRPFAGDDVEVADAEVARHYIEQISALFSEPILLDFPTNRIPNVCDVTTRRLICRCQQCTRSVPRLFLLGARIVCGDCLRSRLHAREVLARTVPWFLSGTEPPIHETGVAR